MGLKMSNLKKLVDEYWGLLVEASELKGPLDDAITVVMKEVITEIRNRIPEGLNKDELIIQHLDESFLGEYYVMNADYRYIMAYDLRKNGGLGHYYGTIPDINVLALCSPKTKEEFIVKQVNKFMASYNSIYGKDIEEIEFTIETLQAKLKKLKGEV